MFHTALLRAQYLRLCSVEASSAEPMPIGYSLVCQLFADNFGCSGFIETLVPIDRLCFCAFFRFNFCHLIHV